MDDKTKRKISRAQKKLWSDEEYRNKMRRAFRVRKTSQTWRDDEFRRKMSERLKECWQDPKFRLKQSRSRSIAAYARWSRPEEHAKMREIMLKSKKYKAAMKKLKDEKKRG